MLLSSLLSENSLPLTIVFKQPLNQDKFISHKDYQYIVNEFAFLYSHFTTLKNSETLSYYCKENSFPINRIDDFLIQYKDLSNNDKSNIIEYHNESFIKKHLITDKLYLDNILKNIDPKIKLDAEQRKVILSDEDYTLVVAGAGAGKTTTVAAKVKYLVEKRGIQPDQILVISFTNKAVDELKSKINKSLGIKCPVTTFHKTGYAIIKRQDEERQTIVDQGFMFNVVNNYLKVNILENPELVDKLILFFSSYFDAPYEGNDLNDFFNYISKADFSTLRGNINEYTEEIIDNRTGKCISITYETLRSSEEVRIANFLYMNGIDYTYEKPYPYNILKSHKPYTPDFTIQQDDKIAYIEHFGITQDGYNTRYSQDQLIKYKQEVNDKVRLHRAHKTDLIYTFSSYTIVR